VGTSRRAAERALNAALAEVDRGEGRRSSRETFEEFATRWLAEHRPRVERATAIDYDNTLRNHLIPYFGVRRLGSIRPDHVRAYAAAKMDGTAPVPVQPNGKSGQIKRRLAPKTINNQITLLGLILGHASADGLIPSNPAAGRDRRRPLKLKEPHRERDYLRPREVPIYLAACSDFWRPRALTLILTGCRVGELLGLQWDDVDWAGSAIVIGRALKADGVGSTKGDETGRRVDMGPRLAEALQDHRALQAERDMAWDDGLVFPGHGGGHDSAKRLLDYEHRPALRRAGLRTTLVNHELRHTAAAVWLSLGLRMEYVRRQLGYRSITTTIRAYGHLERTMVPDAAARTEAALVDALAT
jgi:integrase